ncbi:hypothetical protein [Mongoliitalea daihaiensis]|uniref:hypothetical protein n=1 Tax=Mongoliitalea daihaiensis TaxID=2782006 RepID=UPI001F3FB80A|nr:hypothetical protein [Mongoliitalea daihaiensis]UJP66056.1 hypothetical protein IPZ59_05375 [Mongoliitalea daihaiensis]
MHVKINQKYIESYVKDFAAKVSKQHFHENKYITGPQIVQLTPAEQVNFFVIKALFEAWQVELEKLKSNPYFDYRDKAVHDALKQFMNVLSRTIKIDRENFEPLLISALTDAISLAVDPLTFFMEEIEKTPERQLNTYFKENKRYYKWHRSLMENLIDRAALGASHVAYVAALQANYEQQASELRSGQELLESLSAVLAIDFGALLEEQSLSPNTESAQEEPFPSDVSVEEVKRSALFTPIFESKQEDVSDTRVVVEVKEVAAATPSAAAVTIENKEGQLDPHAIWARFESEEYSVMKISIQELSESIGINQRFMFTKELFEGNSDLLRYALKSIDQCQNFTEAINMLNLRYVDELKWNLQSEALDEFLQLIFRKFEHRG